MLRLLPDTSTTVTSSKAARRRTVSLTTLGALRCVVDGFDTDLPGQRLRFALLTYLALERSAPRARITALLWPEIDESRAAQRLKQTVYELRQTFGSGVIVSDLEELQAGDELSIDARTFGWYADHGELERALDLYQRPFLDGFFLESRSSWEHWVDRKRAILARTFARVASACITKWLERGDSESALRCATRWLNVDDESDEPHRFLMLALARMGRSVDALAHYAVLERQLINNDESTPGRGLKELKAQIDAGALDRFRSLTTAPQSASLQSAENPRWNLQRPHRIQMSFKGGLDKLGWAHRVSMPGG